MRFKQYLKEEYYKRIIPKFSKGSVEIFRNPTMKELEEIHTETESMFSNVLYTIRFIFFPNGDWFAASARIVHDEFDIGDEITQIKAMGYILNNEVKIKIFGNRNKEMIDHVMKKTNLRYEIYNAI
jgi:hypothetical protein